MYVSGNSRIRRCTCIIMQDPYSGPTVAGAIEGDGFSYSKEDMDKMSDIDR